MEASGEETVTEAEGMRSRTFSGTCVSLLKAPCKSASIPDEGAGSISIGSSMRTECCGVVRPREGRCQQCFVHSVVSFPALYT